MIALITRMKQHRYLVDVRISVLPNRSCIVIVVNDRFWQATTAILKLEKLEIILSRFLIGSIIFFITNFAWGKSVVADRSKLNTDSIRNNQLILRFEYLPLSFSRSHQTLTIDNKVYPNDTAALLGGSIEYRRLNFFQQNLFLFDRFQHLAGSKAFTVEGETEKAELKGSLGIFFGWCRSCVSVENALFISPHVGIGGHFASMALSHPTQVLYKQTMQRYGGSIFLGVNLGVGLSNNLVIEMRLGVTNLLYSGYFGSLLCFLVKSGQPLPVPNPQHENFRGLPQTARNGCLKNKGGSFSRSGPSA